MTPVDTLIFLAGLLVLLGIASSKLSARLGLPVLVLFLGENSLRYRPVNAYEETH